MKFVIVWYFILVFSFFVVSDTNAQEEFYELAGEKAPDFFLKGSDGKQYTLSEHLGKIVVLEWFNPRCPMGNIRYDRGLTRTRHEKYTAEGVIWFTVLSAGEGKLGYVKDEETEQMRNRWSGKQTALLLDREGVLAEQYKVEKVPHVVIIDEEGIIIYMGAMDRMTQRRDERGVLIVNENESYVDQVLDALKNNTPVPMVYNKPSGCLIKR